LGRAEQTEQNTQAVRAAAMDSTISYSVAMRQSLFENPEITRIYMAGNVDPDALDELELVRYRVLIQNIMWAFWNMYSQGELTGLSLDVWRVQLLQRLTPQSTAPQ
jgi:hypothetical protein